MYFVPFLGFLSLSVHYLPISGDFAWFHGMKCTNNDKIIRKVLKTLENGTLSLGESDVLCTKMVYRVIICAWMFHEIIRKYLLTSRTIMIY